MTVGEFKAWLEGFSEAMGPSPNVKQWKKIRERLEHVSDSEPNVYFERRRYWWPSWYTIPLNNTETRSTSNTLELSYNVGSGEAQLLSDVVGPEPST